MFTLVNAMKAFVITAVIPGVYTLYSTTSHFQQQLAREGQDVGKIEALMHYSSLTDVWSRMISGWLYLFFISLLCCFLLLLWLKKAK